MGEISCFKSLDIYSNACIIKQRNKTMESFLKTSVAAFALVIVFLTSCFVSCCWVALSKMHN